MPRATILGALLMPSLYSFFLYIINYINLYIISALRDMPSSYAVIGELLMTRTSKIDCLIRYQTGTALSLEALEGVM